MVYLVALVLAEVVAAVSDPYFGLISHGFILLLLLVHGLATEDGDVRALLHSLAAVPLMRVLAFTMPMLGLSTLVTTILAALAVLTLVAWASHSVNLGWRELRLVPRWLDGPLALVMVPLGLALGALDAEVVHTQTHQSIFTITLAVALAVAIPREVVFRGMMLTAGQRLFGVLPAVVYVTVLFVLPHIANLSSADLLVTAASGALFAAVTIWSRSIAGAILASTAFGLSFLLFAPTLLELVSPR